MPGRRNVAFSLTSLDRIKSQKQIEFIDAAHDAILTRLLHSVSARAEDLGAREYRLVERTETHDIERHQELVYLRAWPVVSALVELEDGEELEEGTHYELDRRGGVIHLLAPVKIGPNALTVTYTGGVAEQSHRQTMTVSYFPFVATGTIITGQESGAMGRVEKLVSDDELVVSVLAGVFQQYEEIRDESGNDAEIVELGAAPFVSVFPEMAEAVERQVGYFYDRREIPGASTSVSMGGGSLSIQPEAGLLDDVKRVFVKHGRPGIR